MSQSSNYWAAALQGSPGSQLASMQAKLYEFETTERLMDKFDAKVTGLTMGITDPVELAAAQQLAEALLLAEKRAVARSFTTKTSAQTREMIVKLVIRAGIKPDHDPVRFPRGLMAQRVILTLTMLILIMMQSVVHSADANVTTSLGWP